MKSNIFRSKRAMLAMTQLLGLILAFVVVVASIAIITNLMKLFQPDEGTEAQFTQMMQALDTLYHPSNKNSSCKMPVGYIEPGFAIVGFNRLGVRNAAGQLGELGDEDYGYVEEHCGIDDNIYRPYSCFGNDACMCLCHGGMGDVTGDDCSGGTCLSVSKEIQAFRTFYDAEAVDMVLYGESCWTGANNKVIAGYVLAKEGGVVAIRAVFSEQEFNEKYGHLADCKKLKADLGIGAPPLANTTTTTPDNREAITEDLDNAKITGGR